MKKPEAGSLPEVLHCVECDHTEKVKFHCGAPMHIEGKQLVCWMGTECGVAELPKHHEQYMTLSFN